jgi:hypothetical protein
LTWAAKRKSKPSATGSGYLSVRGRDRHRRRCNVVLQDIVERVAKVRKSKNTVGELDVRPQRYRWRC